MKKIVVDMMGSDLGSAITVEAVKEFHKKHPDYELICVGKKEELSSLDFARIIDARDVVPMTAGALDVLRRKDSSMVVALKTAAEEKADGVVSAGATGGFLSAATLILKKIPGVLRPALITAFPNLANNGETFVTILDVGASNENTPEEMAQFGYMGATFSESVYGIKNPDVKTLANGIEEGKGSPEGKAAYRLLSEDKRINFQGNIEASQVLMGAADVVVTDGYSGNVLLKSTEGTAKGIGKLLKAGFKKNLGTKLGYLLSKSVIGNMKRLMDPKKVGGAMLIGINGVAVKAHGNSNAEAFLSAMEVEYRMIEAQIVQKISSSFEKEETK